jgi:hypothetical protein
LLGARDPNSLVAGPLENRGQDPAESRIVVNEYNVSAVICHRLSPSSPYDPPYFVVLLYRIFGKRSTGLGEIV